MGYCGLLYVLDAVRCCLSMQIFNNCCFKLCGNYKTIKLVLHVKPSSLKMNFDGIIIWKVYIMDIWWSVKLHGGTFHDIHLIYQWRTLNMWFFIDNHITYMKLILNDGSLWAKSINIETSKYNIYVKITYYLRQFIYISGKWDDTFFKCNAIVMLSSLNVLFLIVNIDCKDCIYLPCWCSLMSPQIVHDRMLDFGIFLH